MKTAAVLLFFMLLLLGFDVGFTMIASAYLSIFETGGRQINGTILPLQIVAGIDKFVLVAIPLFVLAGELMNRGGLTRILITWAMSVVGHVRGSLAQVSLLTNLLMAGVSGSGAADAAAIGRTLIPSMKKEGYDQGFAAAIIAAGAMLGPIIPPSVPMIIYATMANVSVIKLFVAGVFPGLLLFLGYSVISYIWSRINAYPVGDKLNLMKSAKATFMTLPVLCLPLVVLGGMRFGFVTDTEAAALAGVSALVVSVFFYRTMNLKTFAGAVADAGLTSAAILFLLAAAGPLGWIISESRVNLELSAYLISLSDNPLFILLAINIALLLLGCILEPLPVMIVFLPALIPIGADLGLDPIHFGTVLIVNLMIGMLTPPIGLLLFVAGAVGEVPLSAIIKNVWPFVLWSLAVLAIITLFPNLVMWLPNGMS